jgi:glucosylceramidase
MRATAILVGMTALFTACSSNSGSSPLPGGESASEVIGPNGGLVELPDGSSVSVPEGALTHDVTISIRTDPNAPSAAALGTPVGLTYLLGPEGQQFLKPVTVTLAIEPSEIPPGETESDIVTYTAPRASSDYTPLGTSAANSLHVVSTTTHFSHVVPLISQAGNPDNITIGFSGELNQFSYYGDFFNAQASLAPSAPSERLCHIYVPWNIACSESDATCASGPSAVSVTTPTVDNWDTLCSQYSSHPSNNDPQYVACWLFAAQQPMDGSDSPNCDEALFTFKGKGFLSEADIHYENAMKAFFSAFNSSHTGYAGGFSFTPWNEPDNVVPAGNGLCSPNAENKCVDGQNSRKIGPDEAAKYYLIIEQLCETTQTFPSPTTGGGCKVAAGDFAAEPRFWSDYVLDNPGHYMRDYKSYIETHAVDYKLNSKYPAYFAFHDWHDINDFLSTGNTCDDASTCMTTQLVKSLSDEGWASAKLWDTESGVNQGGKNVKPLDDGRQSCGAAFLLHLTALDRRITRLYFMRLYSPSSSDYPQPLETNHDGSQAFDVLASHSNYYAPGCWNGEHTGATVSYVRTVPLPAAGLYNVYETTPVGGIGPVEGGPQPFVPTTPCTASLSESGLEPETSSSTVSICIDDRQTYQNVVGFGAAITDSAAYDVVYNMDGSDRDASSRLNGNQQQALLQSLFDNNGSGIGLSVLRQPIGASDFTHDKTPYALVDDNEKESGFSVGHDKGYIIPTIKAALDINGDIQIVGSPWSAPAWMKNPESMIDDAKGKLKNGKPKGTPYSSYDDYYAAYLVAALKGYGAENVHIPYLTPLNEPGEGWGYPGMQLTEQQEEAIIEYVHGKLPDLKILGYDFNFYDAPDPSNQNPELVNPLNLFDKFGAAGALAGMAFHCYGDGDTGVLDNLHGKAGSDPFHLWVTECTSGWDDENALDKQGRVGNSPVDHGHGEAIEQLIRAMRHWSETFFTWNLALGPDLQNPREKREHEGSGCDNCIGVTRILDGTWKPERDFAEIGHASTFVKPGAQVVYSDSYVVGHTKKGAPLGYTPYTGGGPGSAGGIETVAFINPGPDGSHVLVVYNSSESEKTIDVNWTLATTVGNGFQYTVPKRSALTFTWGAGIPSAPTPPPPTDGGTCSPSSSGCYMNSGSGSSAVCDYNWSTIGGFTCADSPGYSPGNCSTESLYGCCVTTTVSPYMDGEVTTTKATCYYDLAQGAAAQSMCGSLPDSSWSTCLP